MYDCTSNNCQHNQILPINVNAELNQASDTTRFRHDVVNPNHLQRNTDIQFDDADLVDGSCSATDKRAAGRLGGKLRRFDTHPDSAHVHSRLQVPDGGRRRLNCTPRRRIHSVRNIAGTPRLAVALTMSPSVRPDILTTRTLDADQK